MKLTTKDIIKILPFDEEFKKDLLENFDKLTDDQKFNIERIVWAGYETLYELKLNENLAIALDEAGRKQEKINSTLYERVRELTDNEMAHISAEDIKSADLSEARGKLVDIMSSKSS